mmetsp:Transcript_1251/g.2879  ORF Transcript_1251/g.2879 Transcript_1251/m.2879 type:complete len:258 (-) Transcript_1251:715-1488(-)
MIMSSASGSCARRLASLSHNASLCRNRWAPWKRLTLCLRQSRKSLTGVGFYLQWRLKTMTCGALSGQAAKKAPRTARTRMRARAQSQRVVGGCCRSWMWRTNPCPSSEDGRVRSQHFVPSFSDSRRKAMISKRSSILTGQRQTRPSRQTHPKSRRSRRRTDRWKNWVSSCIRCPQSCSASQPSGTVPSMTSLRANDGCRRPIGRPATSTGRSIGARVSGRIAASLRLMHAEKLCRLKCQRWSRIGWIRRERCRRSWT